jgi:hypothetical protein
MKKGLSLSVLALLFCANWAFAQQPAIQYYRGWNKDAINVFEPSKTDSVPYTGFKIRIGGSFTQDFQNYKSTNKANYVATSPTNVENSNLLYGVVKSNSGNFKVTNANGSTTYLDSTSSTLTGFNLAMANLNFDMQIGDGVRVCLENYMSARHHNEFWVKGGYIQFDKLPMFGSPKWFTNYLRVKIGHFQPNFGDMQFRRSDGGNTMFNPFVENGIIDPFTTEIGGEVYVFPIKGVMLMGGMSSGFINGNILKPLESVNKFGAVANKRSPSIFGKVAYDNNFNALRFRLSASVYNNSNSTSNTLLAGDRTGSHYFGIMEPAAIKGLPTSIGTADATKGGPNFTSGRFNPSFSNRVTGISISPFVKFHGLEVFAAYDLYKGSVYGDTLTDSRGNVNWEKRAASQVLVEGVYRCLKNEQAFIGARFIKATIEPSGVKYKDVAGKTYNAATNPLDDDKSGQAKVSIDRLAFSAGWFPTKNLLLKAEYMIENYKDFPLADYRYEGKVSGFMVEAVIGF